MNGEVQLVVSQPGGAATYNSGIFGVNPSLNKIYVGDSATPWLGVDFYQMLINTQAYIDVYGDGDVLLDTVQITSGAMASASGTLEYVAVDPTAIAGGIYFIYTGEGGNSYILDLYENETISQTWKYQDLNNFTAQGAFSREFRVPFSDTNQSALGALFDNNAEPGNENYFYYKLPAQILVDTIPIASGYIQVRKIYRRLNRINEVELAFFAETPDLVKALGEKKLADIAALTELDESVNFTTVTTPNANRIWTLCDRAQLWSGGTDAGTRPINDGANPVLAPDLTPALSWWFLLEKIITEAGFELVAGSLENLLTTYWMPWLNSQALLMTQNPNQYFFKVTRGSNYTLSGSPSYYVNFPFNTEVYDNNNNWNTGTYTYTPPGIGTFTLHLHMEFTVTDSSGTGFGANIRFYLRLPGPTPGGIILDPFPFVAGGHTIGSYNRDYYFQVTTGDAFQIVVSATSGQNIIFNTNCYLELTGIDLTTNQTIQYNLNAPDMKQVEFVSDVIKMHNCAIVPSRQIPNRIAIIPQDSYLGTGDLVDWTEKLDVSKDVMVTSTVDIQRSKFRFTYSKGDDYFSQLYAEYNRIYGDFEAVGYTINPGTLASDFITGDQKIELITRSTPCGQIPSNGSVIPMFYNDALEFVVPGPRCLYQANTVAIRLYNEATLSSGFANVPTLCHYSSDYPTVNDDDLNWAPEVPPHASTVTANPYNNLFNKYWRGYMNTLYSPEARIMEAFFALDIKDIAGFRFSDKIWIQDSYWRILEISDYKIGLNESTKVKLLKYLEPVEDCSVSPLSVMANGEVEFQNYGGDTAPATEDCCTRYGYFWDEINGVCWAFDSGNQVRVSPINGTKANPRTEVSATRTKNLTVLDSIITGTDITLATNGKDLLAVGENIELTKAVGAVSLLGKNTYTNMPGLHIGGGYRDGTTFIEKGWAQAGLVILHRKDSYLAAGNAFLFVEGVANEYLEIPDSTVWACNLQLTVWDTNALTYCTGQYSFAISKTGGVAAVSAITPINVVNTTPYTFTVGVNVAVANLHRLYLNVAGGPFPVDIITTASLQYQQSKIA